MPTVFVIGPDWTLRANVRAELRELGVEALGMESVEEAGQFVAEGTVPSVVVLEAFAAGAAGPTLTSLARRVPVVVVASRIEPAPVLGAAAAVLYRPVRVGDVVAQVKQLLAGHAA